LEYVARAGLCGHFFAKLFRWVGTGVRVKGDGSNHCANNGKFVWQPEVSSDYFPS
jgi:hypothetical protein